MSPNRKMRRMQLSELSYEERKKAMMMQQHAKRMHEAHERLRKKYVEIAEKHTPAWAKWISKNVPPKWFIQFFKTIAENMPPRVFMQWLATKRMPHIATLSIFLFFKVPLMLIACVISFIFLWPFQQIRTFFADFGLSAKCYEVDLWEQQLVVKKWGRELPHPDGRITERL